MRTVEITRSGDRSVTDQLAEMRAWLREAGIRTTELEPVRILRARVRFRAAFDNADEAARFIAHFDEPKPRSEPPPCPNCP